MASLQNQIRYHAECTSNLQGFMTYFSLGGGTGSGLGSLLSEYLDSEFGTKLKWQYLITPDETDNEIENKMEAYNAVLATHASFERIDVGFLFDNKAVRNICREKLGISKPSYFNSNELISHVVASTTAAMRFESGLAVDMEEITKTLSPYPRVHFPIASYAPLRSRQYFGRMAPSMGVRQITAQCFDESYQCVEYSPNEGKYIACCQLYRGDIGHPPDLSETVQMVEASKDMKFVNWSPDGVQVGVSETMPAVLSAGAIARERTSGCNLSNTTAIMGLWSRLADTFETNLKEKQLVHLYTEQGLDDFSFSLAKEDLLSLVDDYRNLQSRSEGPFDEEDTFL